MNERSFRLNAHMANHSAKSLKSRNSTENIPKQVITQYFVSKFSLTQLRTNKFDIYKQNLQ